MVEPTHLKDISQIGSFPSLGGKHTKKYLKAPNFETLFSGKSYTMPKGTYPPFSGCFLQHKNDLSRELDANSHTSGQPPKLSCRKNVGPPKVSLEVGRCFCQNDPWRVHDDFGFPQISAVQSPATPNNQLLMDAWWNSKVLIKLLCLIKHPFFM